MDDIVKQAMAKWPNVPHCYGWLRLDARGIWRMRDEAAQRTEAPGDKLANGALVGFINRNYQRDERGCWYFQNGPQRVYVNLEATPFIVRTDPAHGFVLHTGQPMSALEQVFMLDSGGIVLRAGEQLAQLDDRDVAQLLQAMELDGKPVGDEELMAWLGKSESVGAGAGKLSLRWQDRQIAIERLRADAMPQRFGFVLRPDRLTGQK